MSSEIVTSGMLVNQTPVNGASNPQECHMFTHQVEYVDDESFLEHLEWYLEGDIPVGISIDKENGLISGKIKSFMDQPSVGGGPKEKLKIDGSNLSALGRDIVGYTFNFKIKRDYTYTFLGTEESSPSSVIIDTIESDVSIYVIKNNSLDNYIFARMYLEAGESEVIVNGKVETLKHKFLYNGIEYTVDSFGEFIKAHPGPFATCD